MVKKGEEDFPKKRKKIGKKNIDPKATNVNVLTKQLYYIPCYNVNSSGLFFIELKL